jgi:hypothetical protein
MNNMKNIMKHIGPVAVFVAVVAMASLQSCDFLNVNDYFEQTLKYDSVFHNKINIEKYLWTTASFLPDEGDYNALPGSMACDEGFSLVDLQGSLYVLGEITPNGGGNMHHWAKLYQIVRKANTILARMDEAVDLTTLDKREIMGYSYFLRAYAYYLLVMQYGPVVILGDEPLGNNEEASYYDRARATYDESVDYICAELEQAAAYLPTTVAVSFFGRPTRDAALGLIARLRLIQASPLYNGQSAAHITFGNWKRSTDGVNYISQQYDEKKWAVAAAAAKRIIDMNIYSLHTIPRTSDSYVVPANVPTAPFPNGAGDIDPFRSYSDMFTGEGYSSQNPEFLWGRTSWSATSWIRYAFPWAYGGYNTLGVTQKVIDAYRMADGRTIDNSSAEYPYLTTGFKGGSNETFSGYRLNNSVHNMYVNREMRFYASIGFTECFWPCNSTSTATAKNVTVTYYASGNAGKQQAGVDVNNYPITGYVLKKNIHPDDAFLGTGMRQITKAFPIIRYAEILLSYVEALNNLTTSHTVAGENGASQTLSRNTDEIKKYFNMVRFRVGLPGMTNEEAASQQTVQALIERERMVEFLFEGMRYWDVRRWGIYEQTEQEPIMGMDTDASIDGYYSIVPVNHSKARNRVVDRKMILFPILLEEIRKAPSLDQNPGWQD